MAAEKAITLEKKGRGEAISSSYNIKAAGKNVKKVLEKKIKNFECH